MTTITGNINENDTIKTDGTLDQSSKSDETAETRADETAGTKAGKNAETGAGRTGKSGTPRNSKNKTTYIALCGLFAALAAVCSWISIPLGFTPVPVNLATLAVFLAGGLLGAKYGTISLAVYTLIGAVGIPVFAGFRGGVSVLAGPTGGYIIGYIAAAFIVGIIIQAYENRAKSKALEQNAQRLFGKWFCCVLALICGLIACYALGTAWFMISTGTGLGAAMITCVIPFLPGDALKITAATLLIGKLRAYVPR